MKSGVVAVLDVLGIKGVWRRRDPAEVVQAWEALLAGLQAEVDRSRQAQERMLALFGSRDHAVDLQVRAFSDTMILTFSSTHEAALLPVAAAHMVGTFVQALELQLPLRGAIATGELHVSERMILGPAIDDAAEWHEKADWAGVMLTPNTSKHWTALAEGGGYGGLTAAMNELLVHHSVPLHDNQQVDAWCVAWHAGIGREVPAERHALALELIEQLRDPVPSKHANTEAFINQHGLSPVSGVWRGQQPIP